MRIQLIVFWTLWLPGLLSKEIWTTMRCGFFLEPDKYHVSGMGNNNKIGSITATGTNLWGEDFKPVITSRPENSLGKMLSTMGNDSEKNFQAYSKALTDPEFCPYFIDVIANVTSSKGCTGLDIGSKIIAEESDSEEDVENRVSCVKKLSQKLKTMDLYLGVTTVGGVNIPSQLTKAMLKIIEDLYALVIFLPNVCGSWNSTVDPMIITASSPAAEWQTQAGGYVKSWEDRGLPSDQIHHAMIFEGVNQRGEDEPGMIEMIYSDQFKN